jgi:DNA-binding transcriptional regulator YiaG
VSGVELRAWIRAVNPRAVRRANHMPLRVIAQALGTRPNVISRWERSVVLPGGERAERWVRITSGLARHLEVPRD